MIVASSMVLGGAYLAGSIPFGLLLARLRGIDVRLVGSGNIGATNVMRATGRTWGVLTFLLDGAKGAAGPLAAGFLQLPLAVLAAAGLAAMTGHCFSIFLGFRGGKGVATLMGAFAVLDPAAAAAAAVAFVVILGASRYVSLASLGLAITMTLACAWRHGLGAPLTVASGAGLILIILRHRSNWQRLWRGEKAPPAAARRGGESHG